MKHPSYPAELKTREDALLQLKRKINIQQNTEKFPLSQSIIFVEFYNFNHRNSSPSPLNL